MHVRYVYILYIHSCNKSITRKDYDDRDIYYFLNILKGKNDKRK